MITDLRYLSFFVVQYVEFENIFSESQSANLTHDNHVKLTILEHIGRKSGYRIEHTLFVLTGLVEIFTAKGAMQVYLQTKFRVSNFLSALYGDIAAQYGVYTFGCLRYHNMIIHS